MFQPSSPLGQASANLLSVPVKASAAAGCYSQLRNETSVASADAHDLVTMLIRGVQEALLQGRGALKRGDIQAKCEALTRAARIVEEGLKASLNLRDGGAIASNLNDLYTFLSVKITQANIRNDETLIFESMRVLEPIRDAWAGIAASVKAAQSSSAKS